MEENIFENDVQTVGEILRNARIKQGKTISEASKELCIRKSYIEAIEKMDVSQMPQMPYALGFVRSYANYLGLNSDRIISSYRKTVTGDNQDEEENIAHLEPSVPKIRHLLFGFIGLVALFLVWSYWPEQIQIYTETEVSVNDVVPEPEIIDETQSATEGSAPEEDVSSQEEEYVEQVEEKQQNNEGLDNPPVESDAESSEKSQGDEKAGQIRFVLTGPSWVELKQGDNVLLSGIYHKDFEYEIPAEEGMVISVGRYYNAEFYIDGKKVKVVSSLKHDNVSLDKFLKKN